MAPELYSVMIADVPFMDVINTQLDPSLPLVIGEYDEVRPFFSIR
jgi:oligopeptidase B